MKIAANNAKERTKFCIRKVFVDDDHNYDDEVTLYIPFEVLMKVVIRFCEDNYEVGLDGSNNAIWNLFSGTGFIESLFEDDDFVDEVTKAYEDAGYCEMDYQDWVNSKPWEE